MNKEQENSILREALSLIIGLCQKKPSTENEVIILSIARVALDAHKTETP